MFRYHCVCVFVRACVPVLLVALTFNDEQIACICETLLRSCDLPRLHRFLGSIPDTDGDGDDDGRPPGSNPGGEWLLRARVHAALDRRNFSRVFSLIQNHWFDRSCHAELQGVWHRALYLEAEAVRGRRLGAVDKYRLRKKHPPPMTIWDGEKTVYCFKVTSRTILKDSYRANRYPTAEDKQVLAVKTGLNVTQINNWYKNRRQRDKPVTSPSSKQLSTTSLSPVTSYPAMANAENTSWNR